MDETGKVEWALTAVTFFLTAVEIKNQEFFVAGYYKRLMSKDKY